MRSTSSVGMSAVLRVAVGVGLLALLVMACTGNTSDRDATVSGPGSGNQPQVDGGGWELLAIEANEVEGFSSLADMGRIADVVVVAQATAIEGVRELGKGDDAIELAQVRFQVTRAISNWDADSVLVEFLIPSSEVMKALENQIADLPLTILALRDKGDLEAGYYRLVNSSSLWTEQPSGGLIAPLAEDDGRDFASEVAEIRGLEDLGDHLEATRR